MAEPVVYVVDDAAAVRRSLARLIRATGLEVETFASAIEFLRHEPGERPSCLLLDLRLPGMNGLELQEELARAERAMPIIFLTGHGTVPASVRAMKAGAADFLEKPVSADDLLPAICQAIDKDATDRQERAYAAELKERGATLSPREHQVFALVVTGLLNKQVASRLGISEKTVKVHRSRVMKKLQAASLAELVGMARVLNPAAPD